MRRAVRGLVGLGVVAAALGPSGAQAAPKITGSITLGGRPQALAVDGAADRLYVANWSLGAIDVIDTVARGPLPNGRILLDTAPLGVAVHPARKRVYASGSTASSLFAIDTLSDANRVIATIAVGTGPSAVAVNTQTDRVYVANTDSNTVSVVDVASDANAVVATIAVGTAPVALALGERDARLFVANRGANTVSVLDIARGSSTENSVLATLTTNLEPNALALNSVTNRLYVGHRAYFQVYDFDVGHLGDPPSRFNVSDTDSLGIDPRTNILFVGRNGYTDVQMYEGTTHGYLGYLDAGSGGNPWIGIDPGAEIYVARPTEGAVSIVEYVAETIISSGPVGSVPSTSASFTFYSSEGGTLFRCRLDGGLFQSCTSPKSYVGLSEALHTFEVQSVDGSGNPLTPIASRTWRVDLGPPETEITDAPPAVTNRTTATFSFMSNESPPAFRCQIDSLGFVPCNPPVSYGVTGNATHRFDVQSVDAGGNVDSTPATWTWTVDLLPPDTAIDALTGPPQNATVTTTQATLRFSSPTDPSATFQCSLDDGVYADCASPHTVSSLPNGRHKFSVRAIDPAGNVDGSPATRNWLVDATGPVVTFIAGPSGPTNTTEPFFSFDADEQVSAYECRLDAGAFEPSCASPKRFAGLAEGEHTFYVRGTDLYGNVSSAPATRRFRVDITPPETTLDSKPDEFSASPTAIFRFSSNEEASFECSLDNSAFEECLSPRTLSSLSEGNHRFRVRATDAAGNMDLSPTPHAWYIDGTPPTVSIARPIIGSIFSSDGNGVPLPVPVVAGAVTVRASAIDQQSGIGAFSFLVDGVPQPFVYDAVTGDYRLEAHRFTTCAVAGQQVQQPAPCLHTITARAENAAGLPNQDTIQIFVIPT